jgi:hypothetical protein
MGSDDYYLREWSCHKCGHSWDKKTYNRTTEKEYQMSAKQLQSLLIDDVTVDDLILARANLTSLSQGYQEIGVDTPEWVSDKLILVTEEITKRNRTELQRQLKQAKTRRSALATADEKRQALDAMISELEKKLG